MNSIRLTLSVLIIAYIVIAALYTIYTPKWQAPDEPAHFNYIRAIADTGALPVLQLGDYDHDFLEKIKAAKFPASLPVDAIRYESYQPPLYYLAAAPVYLLARGGGVDTQVLALRLFGVALGAIFLIAAYRIVREIFPAEPLLALATVGVMATVPQHIAISASISNDTAANLLLALILWIAVRRAKNLLTDKRFALYGGLLFGAALLTKTTTYVPAAGLIIGAEVARLSLGNLPLIPNAARPTLYGFALALILFAPWLIRGTLTYGIADPLGITRHDAIVIGQPTTAQMIAQYGLRPIAFDFIAITFKSFWAQFGWMGVLVNDRIYVALILLSGVGLLGFAAWSFKMIRRREQLSQTQHWLFGLLFMLTATAFADYLLYNLKFFQLQGRYLFPALIPIALFFVIGLREVMNREYERVVFGVLYIGMLGLDLVSLFWFIVPQLQIAN